MLFHPSEFITQDHSLSNLPDRQSTLHSWSPPLPRQPQLLFSERLSSTDHSNLSQLGSCGGDLLLQQSPQQTTYQSHSPLEQEQLLNDHFSQLQPQDILEDTLISDYLTDSDPSIWNPECPDPAQQDFDWTALGLDPLGTQLLLPDQSQQLMLGGDLSANSLDLTSTATSTMGSTGADQLFAEHTLHPHSTGHLTPPSTRNPTPPYTMNLPTSNINSYMPESSPSHSSSHSDDAPPSKEDASVKRQRNTMAARRYRQRRLDRLADLERQLAEMTADRDDLRVKLARREAEVGALRDVLAAKK